MTRRLVPWPRGGGRKEMTLAKDLETAGKVQDAEVAQERPLTQSRDLRRLPGGGKDQVKTGG